MYYAEWDIDFTFATLVLIKKIHTQLAAINVPSIVEVVNSSYLCDLEVP